MSICLYIYLSNCQCISFSICPSICSPIYWLRPPFVLLCIHRIINLLVNLSTSFCLATVLEIKTIWESMGKKLRYLWAEQKHWKVRFHIFVTSEIGKTCFPESLQKHCFCKKWVSRYIMNIFKWNLKNVDGMLKKCIEHIEFS